MLLAQPAHCTFVCGGGSFGIPHSWVSLTACPSFYIPQAYIGRCVTIHVVPLQSNFLLLLLLVTAVSNGIWGQLCLSELCLFFLSILKDRISLLNRTLYGSPKCLLWTFAKNFMMGSQLTKNRFFSPKKWCFFKKIQRKNDISGNVRPSTEGTHSKTSFRKD